MGQNILWDVRDAICTITLNQPDLRNAISDEDMVEDIVAALERLNRDGRIRAAILTGAGKAFSAGGNLKKMATPGGLGGGTPQETRLAYRHGIQRIPLAFEKLEVPIIAAVNGPAIGAGCDLACMCDIRVAGESASFAESFVKIGLIPGDGGAWLLQRVIGFSRAAELTFTGEAVGAKEALAMGLVSHVVPDADLLAKARSIAEKIAANPPHAVRMAKQLMLQARQASLANILDMSAAMQAIVQTTADHKEAVEAFRQKRLPKFTGA
jgi:enoyl-CoA hydratase/carnithine racemase